MGDEGGSEEFARAAVSEDLEREAWLLSLGPEERDRFVRYEERLVVRARRHLPTFFAYVMREESTRREIECAAHQEVFFDFVMHHDRSVVMMPVGTSKTFSLVALTLFLLAHNRTLRGAVVSATQEQAKKVVGAVSDYVLFSPALRRVFPDLRRSTRQRDPWTQAAITVDRPPGIRDASLFAVGIDGGLPGARLNWIIVDDILNRENTATNEQRSKVYEFFDSTVLSRLDPVGARVCVTNVTWHPKDLVHQLEDQGWPALRMDIYGDVKVQDDAEWMREGREPWQHPGLRPRSRSPVEECYRLRANDPDPENRKTLWEGKFPMPVVEKIRALHLPGEFNRGWRMVCRDDGTAMCQQEYVDLCKRLARERGVLSMTSKYEGANPTFTGVDLAVSPGEESDDTAFFTFEARPDGTRCILDIEAGKWSGPVVIEKLFRKQAAYKSVVCVENNACLVPDTNVLTRERGYVPISDVHVGEHVWTHRGRWRPILEVISSVAKLVTRFKVRGGLEFRLTPNHWAWMREAGRTPGRKGGHHRPVGEAEWVSVGFANREAYAALATPTWPRKRASIKFASTRKSPGGTLRVDEELALVLGLFVAEGHKTTGQLFWTLSSKEMYLALFIRRVLQKHLPWLGVAIRECGSTIRVIANSRGLAAAFASVGKGAAKRLPIGTLGWPLSLRLAVVRGWLLGDGSIGHNNGWTKEYFQGATISRNWAAWVRATLLEAGYRPSIARNAYRATSIIEGRTVNRSPIYVLRLPSDDSYLFRKEMTTAEEEARWPRISLSTWGSGGGVVWSSDGAWSRVMHGPGTWEQYGGPVFNLVVKEDESYTAEDVIVHNAQDFIRQFALQRDKSLPIKGYTTGRSKAHPEHGVPGLFLEMSNGAWLIPNDRHGNVHPQVQRFVDECLYYAPSRHTGDVLMANFMAREQAKRWGMLGKRANGAGPTGALDLLTR